MPIAFELAPANAPEREVAAEMLRRVQLDGYTTTEPETKRNRSSSGPSLKV
jgi:hypothetical protein